MARWSWRAVVAACVLLAALAVGPLTGWYRVVTIRSGSMAPALPVGTLVVATPTEPAELRTGDVVTYEPPEAPGTLVTHRVVAVGEAPSGEPIVRTKGDANLDPDPSAVRFVDGPAWRARLTLPYLGWLLAALRAPAAKALTMVVAPALLGYIWLRDLRDPQAREPLARPVLRVRPRPTLRIRQP